MDSKSTLGQTLTRYLIEDQILDDLISAERAGASDLTADLSGQIATRIRAANELTSHIQSRKISIDRFGLPAPSKAVKLEHFANSGAARDRLDLAGGELPKAQERIENYLAAIAGIRRARVQAQRRLQLLGAVAISLAFVFGAIVVDRVNRAQAAFDTAIAALSRGDVKSFDTAAAEATNLIPGYRARELSSQRLDWQKREDQYQTVVSALTRGDFAGFDREVATLKMLDPEYNKDRVVALVATRSATPAPIPTPLQTRVVQATLGPATPLPTPLPTRLAVSTRAPTETPPPLPTATPRPASVAPGKPDRTCTTGFAAITSPVNGQRLRGVVDVRGSAICENFQYYKFEFVDARCAGGLCFVAGQFRQPVNNGLLMTWDTTRVGNGSYRLRLTVVGQPAVTYAILPSMPEITVVIDN